jgi:prepilin signal peptidase PulO-like enzyme (type II secretory pathway)
VWLVAIGLGWLAYERLGWQLESLLLAIEAWCFLAVAIIDLEYRRVLNQILLPLLPLIALVNFWTGAPDLISALSGASAGFGLFLFLALLKPGSMGMGDVKLAGIIGFAVGLQGAVIALLISVYSGGLAALAILLYHRFRRGQTMAYAPYLVLGAWIALYFGSEIWPFHLI